MATLAGSDIDAGIVKASTHGTAVQAATGGRLKVTEIRHNQDTQALADNTIGSGKSMETNQEIGRRDDTVGFTGYFGFQNFAPLAIHSFLQAAATATEVTGGQADYRHRLTHSRPTSRSPYTLAFEATTTEVFEYPSCYCTALSLKTEGGPGRIVCSADYIANARVLNTAVNTNANLAAATEVDTELAAFTFADSFWIDTQSSGALASGDALAITDYSIDLVQPQSFPFEIKGAAGYGEPIYDGMFAGTLTITLRNMSALTYFTAHDAETTYKSLFTVEGSQIGTGTNKSLKIFAPRMKLISSPSWSPSSPGENSQTLTFALFEASSAPTGMDSVKPYVEIVNGRATDY